MNRFEVSSVSQIMFIQLKDERCIITTTPVGSYTERGTRAGIESISFCKKAEAIEKYGNHVYCAQSRVGF